MCLCKGVEEACAWTANIHNCGMYDHDICVYAYIHINIYIYISLGRPIFTIVVCMYNTYMYMYTYI